MGESHGISMPRDLAFFITIILVVYILYLGFDYYAERKTNDIRAMLVTTLEGKGAPTQIQIVDPLEFGARCRNKTGSIGSVSIDSLPQQFPQHNYPQIAI